MKIYNKLVRDNIPGIIAKDGKIPIIKVLDDKEYKEELSKKLLEEVNEYLKAEQENKLEELIDIQTVLNAILTTYYTEAEFMHEYVDKLDKKGGFVKKVYLMGVKEGSDNNGIII